MEYLDNLGPVLCMAWWWLRVKTCSPEVVII